MVALDDIVREFLVESTEGLDQLDRDFVTLEQHADDPDVLSRVFRCIHTIKGTCGFLGFSSLEAVTHEGESLLSLLRDGALRLTPELTTVLLRLVDAVRTMLATIEATGADAGHDFQDLIAALAAVRAPTTPVRKGRKSKAVAVPSVAAIPPHPPQHPAPPATATPAAAAPAAVADGVADEGAAAESRPGSVADTTLRVDVGLLDKLMNLVGELVLARNQVLQFTGKGEDAAFLATSGRLNLITTELQEGVMKTRMQPIGNIWGKLPRVVRDLATAGGKQIRLDLIGKETELDKTIIEAVKDPLTHLVRNAVDHGLERPELRLRAGKGAEGTLRLRAYHEGGQVNIEIADDGAGIDLERVKQKAIQRGIITGEQASRMSEREILDLIFLPGFSTAETVTNVSGRGVGMDVVKTNVEKIGGVVDVQTVPGSGTTFKIKIPLTLAIIPALVVTTGGDRYAIPQVSLLELVRLEGEQARKGIEMIHGAPVYRLRGNLLPLVYLNRALKVSGAAERDGLVNIVVLRADGHQFGIVVDAVNDSEEIVVKPLGRHLKGITTFAGATIMGDGTVALILDVLGLAQASEIVNGARDRAPVNLAGHSEDHASDRQAVLITRLGDDGRLAIPLSKVARLEEFERAKVEHASAGDVVQYRDRIMPLIHVAQALGSDTPEGTAERLQVVVYTSGARSYGLVVDRIVDIVEESITVQEGTGHPGLLGAAVIQGRVTDLLDLEAVVHAYDPASIARQAA
jgi:two-component system chemotaxis sensor kinase CheA